MAVLLSFPALAFAIMLVYIRGACFFVVTVSLEVVCTYRKGSVDITTIISQVY